MSNKQGCCKQLPKYVRIQDFCQRHGKAPVSEKRMRIFSHGLVTWKVMQRSAWKHCELANKSTQQLHKVATPCLDNHQFKEEEMGSAGELSQVCTQIVLTCLLLTRIGRPDIIWSVKTVARAVTKWTEACDKRVARSISYVHHTCEFRQYYYVGNTA